MESKLSVGDFVMIAIYFTAVLGVGLYVSVKYTHLYNIGLLDVILQKSYACIIKNVIRTIVNNLMTNMYTIWKYNIDKCNTIYLLTN